jgi:hypothetical protein
MTFQNIASLTRDNNLGDVTEFFESFIGLFSSLESFHVVNFLLAVVRGQVELVVSGSHLLHKLVSD